MASSLEVFQRRRDDVVAWLGAAPGVRCHKPDGAFYVFASCAEAIGRKTPAGTVVRNDADFAMHLLESQNVAVIHGDAYGLSPCFRISFAAPQAQLEEGCRRIRLACEQLVQ